MTHLRNLTKYIDFVGHQSYFIAGENRPNMGFVLWVMGAG